MKPVLPPPLIRPDPLHEAKRRAAERAAALPSGGLRRTPEPDGPVNPQPGRQREVKESEHLAAGRAKLIEEALAMSASLPRDASDEARGALKALWQEIAALKRGIDELRGLEGRSADEEHARYRGRERER
jgi:hypothetical protein